MVLKRRHTGIEGGGGIDWVFWFFAFVKICLSVCFLSFLLQIIPVDGTGVSPSG